VRIDRRTARAQATRAAVVDALLHLLNEGDPRPTAPRIAARAGVSLRSVFQHFADLEGLFAAAADRQSDHMRRLARPLDGTGSLESRLATFVAQRARILEAIAPVRRAALRMAPFSNEIRARLAHLRARGRSELERVFARELHGQPRGARNEMLTALSAASGFAAWDALRSHEGLSPARAQRVMQRTLRALLSGL